MLGYAPAAAAPRGLAPAFRSNRVAPYAAPPAAEAAGGSDAAAPPPHLGGAGAAPAAGAGAGAGAGGGSAWVPSSAPSPLGPRAMYLRSMPSPRPGEAGRPSTQPPSAQLQYLPQQHPLQHFQQQQHHQQQGLGSSLLRKGSQESLVSSPSTEGPLAQHPSGSEPDLASADSPRRSVSWADEHGFALEEVRARSAARARAAFPPVPLPPLHCPARPPHATSPQNSLPSPCYLQVRIAERLYLSTYPPEEEEASRCAPCCSIS
jgi:hypothetical protein